MFASPVFRDWRLKLNAALVTLPTLAFVAFGVCFLMDKAPEIVRNERQRVMQAYRLQAVEARETGVGEKFDFAASGLRKGDRRIGGEPWGYLTKGGRTTVWYFKEGSAYWFETEQVREFDFRWLFYAGGGTVMVLLLALTVFGVRFFVGYVKSRDDFLAATAHDLMTPLVGLRYALGRSAEDARTLTERLVRIVENIRDFMRLGGRRVPKTERFDLVAAYREAYALFAADYRDLLDADVPVEGAENPLYVRGDETMAVQAIWNLLGNDLKYAAPFGPVRVRFAADGDCVRLDFLDEGQGMTPQQMCRAFDRYYRAKTVLESGKGGFGIGLCTAREFARTMGGDLTLRANAPKGCVFTLSLPVSP